MSADSIEKLINSVRDRDKLGTDAFVEGLMAGTSTPGYAEAMTLRDLHEHDDIKSSVAESSRVEDGQLGDMEWVRAIKKADKAWKALQEKQQ